LTIAGVALPATHFVFTNHASALRGAGDSQSALIRGIHFSECIDLRIQGQVIRGSCTTLEAQLMVDTAMNRNHDDMTEFCNVHGIVPARNSFPYEVVVANEDLASKEKQMSAVINALASAQQQIRMLAEVPSGQDTVEIMSAFLRTYHNAHITFHE
jgi:hypothetical protein